MFCSKPNGFYSLLPLDIPTTRVFIKCPRCILPNIRQKNRRDIDGSLGMSASCFEAITLCVAKPLGRSVVTCRHRVD